jgi:SAM-dependent methyltransferase
MSKEMAHDDIAPEAELTTFLAGVADLYEKNLDEHGLTSKSVGWKDEASQLLRFEKLVEVFDRRAPAEDISVNDLGCGYGAMFSYLESMPSIRLAQYNGYDISDEMLAAAKQAIPDQRAAFIMSPKITCEADYSFVSGTFNVKLEASDEHWASYIKEMLMNLSVHSRRGFAFNLLSTYVDWKQENLYYGDPFMFFDFCKRNISRYVSLLHDYPLYEWTIVVRKGSASARIIGAVK